MTEWTVETTRGKMLRVRVLGANGRVSYGGSARGDREVRFYRSATAKQYDAVIPEVKSIWNTNVMIEELGATPEAKEQEVAYEAIRKERFDSVIEAVLKGRTEDEDEWPVEVPF